MLKSEIESALSDRSSGEFHVLAESLLDDLRQETAIYRELFHLIKKEREIIGNPSLEVLNANNSKKEAVLLKAKLCQQSREETLKQFKEILPVDHHSELTLSLISSYAEGDLKQRLLDCRKELYALIRVVKNHNDWNKRLLQDSISSIRATISFIQNLTSSPMNYMSSGQLQMALPNGKILNEEG